MGRMDAGWVQSSELVGGPRGGGALHLLALPGLGTWDAEAPGGVSRDSLPQVSLAGEDRRPGRTSLRRTHARTQAHAAGPGRWGRNHWALTPLGGAGAPPCLQAPAGQRSRGLVSGLTGSLPPFQGS